MKRGDVRAFLGNNHILLWWEQPNHNRERKWRRKKGKGREQSTIATPTATNKYSYQSHNNHDNSMHVRTNSSRRRSGGRAPTSYPSAARSRDRSVRTQADRAGRCSGRAQCNAAAEALKKINASPPAKDEIYINNIILSQY